MIFDAVTLRDRTPLAVSSTRYLYLHPCNPDLLIKVHKLASEHALTQARLTAWQKRSWRFQFFSGILREFQGYLAHHYATDNPFRSHILPIHGLIETDLGIGMLMTAARRPDGELAPTLRSLFRDGAVTRPRALVIQQFLRDLLATDQVVGDLNMDNIVLAAGPDGSEALKLVDGLGERTWIPIQRWSGFARRRQRNRFVHKVTARCRQQGIHLEL